MHKTRISGIQALCLASFAVFAAVMFLPAVYVLTYALNSSFSVGPEGRTALLNSLAIGAAVTVLDVAFGVPVAWALSRRRFRLRHAIDTLIDMPLVVPTSVLGISVYYFWGAGMGSLLGVEGGLVSRGPILIALLHIAFTFPYMVRSLKAAMSQIEQTHEQAATMLGACPLTVFRTVSAPLFRAGLVSGMILSFTRSLSETGATMMVAGLTSTAPTVVVAYKKAGNIPEAAAVSVVLIVASVLLLLAARRLSGGFRVPVFHVWPAEERLLCGLRSVRDAASSMWVLLVILLPTFYILASGYGSMKGDILSELSRDGDIISAIAVSFMVAAAVTVVNLALAIPLGILISRNMFRAGAAVDTLGDIILIVPTSALGISLSMFWKGSGIGELAVIALAHLSFTFPLMLKPITAAMTAVDPGLEEAARTLGADQARAFRTVTLPLIRPAIIAGIIMTFMRSISETGATLAVSDKVKTIPVLLVELFGKETIDQKTMLACVLLFLCSFALIIALKRMGGGKDADN
jgi:thiamine transport system permease protein